MDVLLKPTILEEAIIAKASFCSDYNRQMLEEFIPSSPAFHLPSLGLGRLLSSPGEPLQSRLWCRVRRGPDPQQRHRSLSSPAPGVSEWKSGEAGISTEPSDRGGAGEGVREVAGRTRKGGSGWGWRGREEGAAREAPLPQTWPGPAEAGRAGAPLCVTRAAPGFRARPRSRAQSEAAAGPGLLPAPRVAVLRPPEPAWTGPPGPAGCARHGNGRSTCARRGPPARGPAWVSAALSSPGRVSAPHGRALSGLLLPSKVTPLNRLWPEGFSFLTSFGIISSPKRAFSVAATVSGPPLPTATYSAGPRKRPLHLHEGLRGWAPSRLANSGWMPLPALGAACVHHLRGEAVPLPDPGVLRPAEAARSSPEPRAGPSA